MAYVPPRRPFPPELVDMVLQNLQPVDWGASWPIAHDQRQALSACALVSRSCYFIARPYLFRSVVYSFQKGSEESMLKPIKTARWTYHPDADPYHSAMHVPLKTLDMFVQFLDRSPNILSSIRQLRLACYPGLTRETQHREYGFSTSDCIELEVVLTLLKKIPNLEVLHTWNILPTESPTAIDSYISLESLRIHQRTTFPQELGMGRLLSGFSRVDHLEISFDTPYWEVPTQVQNLPGLEVKSLELTHVWDSDGINALLPKLSASPTRHSLRELTFYRVDYRSIRGVDAYIRKFEDRIRKLTLVFEPEGAPSANPQATLDLTQLSSLQELTIGWSFLTEMTTLVPTRPAVAIIKYLSTLKLTPRSNSRLKRITLFFGGDDYHTTIAATGVWWKSLAADVTALETVLAGLVDALSLDGIYLKCGLSLDVEESRDLMLRIFPNLCRYNLLAFEDDWYDDF